MRTRNQSAQPLFAEATLSGEWARLVRLCTRLTASPEAAEDLAQETLFEAWRHRDRVHDPQGQVRWHNAIARNVCRRWQEQRGREVVHLLPPCSRTPGKPDVLLEELADPASLDAEVERSELAILLDRALHLLPEPTRQVLLARYVQELPYAVIAAQMGLREGTVKVQIHRGKQALRQVLVTHFCEEAYGVFTSYTSMPAWFQGVTGFKPALNRVMRWVNTYYQKAVYQSASSDSFCGWSRAALPVPHVQTNALPEPGNQGPGRLRCCAPCGQGGRMRHANLVFYLPKVWQFWHDHPRLQLLEEQFVTYHGRAALVTSFRSLTELTQLDVVLAQETYEILCIQPSPDVYHLRSLGVLEEPNA